MPWCKEAQAGRESSLEQNPPFQLLQKVLGGQENGGELPVSGAVPPGGGGGVCVRGILLLPPRGVFTKVKTTKKRAKGNFAKVHVEFWLKQR